MGARPLVIQHPNDHDADSDRSIYAMHNGTCTKRYSGTQHAMSTGVTHERGDTKFDDVTMAKKLDDSLLETSLFDVGAQIHLRG